MSEGPLFSLLKLSLMRRWASLSPFDTCCSFSIIIQVIYHIFKTVDLYQKNILEHSVRAKTDNNLSDVSDVSDVNDVTDAVAILLYCLFLCAELIPFDFSDIFSA